MCEAAVSRWFFLPVLPAGAVRRQHEEWRQTLLTCLGALHGMLAMPAASALLCPALERQLFQLPGLPPLPCPKRLRLPCPNMHCAATAALPPRF